jgi:signal peptidase I
MEPTINTLLIGEVGSKSKLREYSEAIIIAVVSALIIRTCVIQSFKIPSGSMENTLIVGDCLLVNKFIYGIKVPFTDLRLPSLRNPKRGDVVVFRYPLDHAQDYIKRVVGIPGDQIQIRQKQVYVNGIPYHNPHELHTDTQTLPPEISVRDNFGPVQVPANSYFMMGDNRDNSYDSRFWGFVDGGDLVGYAFIKFWSWDKDKLRPRLNRIGKLIR